MTFFRLDEGTQRRHAALRRRHDRAAQAACAAPLRACPSRSTKVIESSLGKTRQPGAAGIQRSTIPGQGNDFERFI
jgi:hypothetical protein